MTTSTTTSTATASAPAECVTLEVKDHIAWVTLNRPEKHNALNMDMFKGIDKVSKRLLRDKSLRHVRAVIIQGNGENFCTGLDVKSILKHPASALKLLWKWWPFNANLAQRVSNNWRKLEVPVIMCLHGKCWGGGMQIALGGDFRITTPDTTLSVMEARWGLIPDMGGTIAMREIMALDRGLELAMTAKVINAETALQSNLITHISDNPQQRAVELAQEIAQNSPDAVAKIKRVFQKAWHRNDGDVLARESFWQWLMIMGKNQRIAVKRNNNAPDTPYNPRR